MFGHTKIKIWTWGDYVSVNLIDDSIASAPHEARSLNGMQQIIIEMNHIQKFPSLYENC